MRIQRPSTGRRVRSQYLSLALVLLFSSVPATKVFGFDEEFYSKNDILYYNEEACSSSGASASTAAPTNAKRYTNPVIDDYSAAPAIIQGDDGTYHIFTTGFRHYTSKDLVKWDKKQDRDNKWFNGGYPSWVNGDHWAPDIVKTGDKYTFVYTSGAGSSKRIGYGTSSSLSPPFDVAEDGTLVGDIPGYATIDPFLLDDGDGKYILYFGSNKYDKGIQAIEYKLANGSLHKVSGPTTAMPGDADGTLFFTNEAPYVIKRNGYYYMFYSAGTPSRGTYEIRVARSKRAIGGYDKPAGHKPILTSSDKFKAPGQNSVFRDGAGRDWIVYQAVPKHSADHNQWDDRRAMMDPINWENDWPTVGDGHPSAGGDAPTPGTPPPSTDDNNSTPASCVCEAPGGSQPTSLHGRDGAEKIYNYFIDQGLQPIHAAGVTGNAAIESAHTFNPLVFGGASNRYRGIFQWGYLDKAPQKTGEDPGNGFQISTDTSDGTMSGGRWGGLVTWTKGQNLDPLTLDGQLGFAWHEATTDADPYDIEDLKQTPDERQAALQWGRYFERAVNGDGTLQAAADREEAATLALQQFGDGAGGGDGAQPIVDTGGSGDCGSSGQGLVSGGMSLSQAQSFMSHYKDLARTYADRRGVFTIPGEGVKVYGSGCSESALANCTSFTEYFVGKYTRGTQAFPNGNEMVGALLATNSGFKDGGSTPKVYAVFSRQSGGGGAGHTGIVLGMDTDNGKMIIGQASCGAGMDGITAQEVSIADFSTGDYSYAYTDDILKGGGGSLSI